MCSVTRGDICTAWKWFVRVPIWQLILLNKCLAFYLFANKHFFQYSDIKILLNLQSKSMKSKNPTSEIVSSHSLVSRPQVKKCRCYKEIWAVGWWWLVFCPLRSIQSQPKAPPKLSTLMVFTNFKSILSLLRNVRKCHGNETLTIFTWNKEAKQEDTCCTNNLRKIGFRDKIA